MKILKTSDEFNNIAQRAEYFPKISPTFDALVDEEFKQQKNIIGIYLLPEGGYEFVINERDTSEIQKRMESEKSQVREYLGYKG